MRRPSLLIFVLFILLTGCYDGSNAAKVRINLGNLPIAHNVQQNSIIDKFLTLFLKPAYAQSAPGDVAAVHIGAFDINNQLLASESININQFPANNTIEFEVPAGNDRTIVVLGEIATEGAYGTVYYIRYYGKADTDINNNNLDLKPGSDVTVSVSMGELYSALNPRPYDILSRMEWDKITGADKYNIYDGSQAYTTSVTENFYVTTSGTHYVEANFAFIGKTSEQFSIFIC